MDRPTSRILRLAAASIAVVAGTAVWPFAAATPVAQALDNTPWVLPSSPPRCTTQKVESGDVAGCVITFYDEPSATGWGVPPAPGVGEGWRWNGYWYNGSPALAAWESTYIAANTEPVGGLRAGTLQTHVVRARPVRGLPRRDQRQGLPRPRRQRLLVPLHERQRRLELPEWRPDRPVQPRVGSGDRHQRRRQPDPELLLDRRRDGVHDSDPDRHAAVGDRDRREVGPLLGRLRLERGMPEHVDPAHRGLARPASLRVPWHASAGGGDRRLQPAQRPEHDLPHDRRRRRPRCRAMLARRCRCRPPAPGFPSSSPRRRARWRR